VDDRDPITLMAGALALLVLGIAAGGGGLYLLRRSPAPAPTDAPPADTTPDADAGG
jgi:hypothetical protein